MPCDAKHLYQPHCICGSLTNAHNLIIIMSSYIIIVVINTFLFIKTRSGNTWAPV